jgi:hypothetical protein
MLKKIKNWIQKYKDSKPTRLPDGMTELENWTQSLIDTYGFPDNDSVRFMIAAMIMQTGPEDAYVPKRKFALMGLAAASKEVAHARLVELKERQQAKATAEASAPPTLTIATEATDGGQTG